MTDEVLSFSTLITSTTFRPFSVACSAAALVSSPIVMLRLMSAALFLSSSSNSRDFVESGEGANLRQL
jgi:hypothetical protein